MSTHNICFHREIRKIYTYFLVEKKRLIKSYGDYHYGASNEYP